MSQESSTIGSGPGAAPPPAPAVAPPPSDATPPPVAAPPATGGDVAAPGTATAPPVPGAPPPANSEQAIEQLLNNFREKSAALKAGETQPPVQPPSEVAPPPAAEAPPIEPIEATTADPAPPTEPEVDEQAPPVEAAADEPTSPVDLDLDDLDQVLTADVIKSRWTRQNSEFVDQVVKREAHRGQLLQTVNDIGGEAGVELSKIFNPIIWKVDPTEEDADAFMDGLVLTENAGALKLAQKLSTRLVNLAINDEATGKEFGGNLIKEEWGTKADGTPWDFAGMDPVDLVSTLLRAAQDGVINVDFIKGELEGQPKSEPSARELQLLEENKQLRAGQQEKEAENQRQTEEMRTQYTTQARSFVSQHIMRAVMPLAVKANWAAGEGEEGPTVSEKKELGELVSDHINYRLEKDPAYGDAMKMINDNEAFDAAGIPTKRFLKVLEPLVNKSKGMFQRKQTALNSRLKFASQNSHNARLARKLGTNGSQPANTASPSPEPPPPVQVAPPPKTDAYEDSETKINRIIEEKRRKQQEAAQPVGFR